MAPLKDEGLGVKRFMFMCGKWERERGGGGGFNSGNRVDNKPGESKKKVVEGTVTKN